LVNGIDFAKFKFAIDPLVTEALLLYVVEATRPDIGMKEFAGATFRG
jgi:hypothetical protein